MYDFFAGNVEFTIMVQKGSGNFEVVEGGAAIVTGRIYVPENIDRECVSMPPLKETETKPDTLPLSSRDVYKELRLRGYNYKGLFRGITEANNEGTNFYILNFFSHSPIRVTRSLWYILNFALNRNYWQNHLGEQLRRFHGHHASSANPA